MSSASFPILLALIVQLVLGFAVFGANPKRESNQCFLFLSAAIGLWLGSFYYAFTTSNPAVAALAIKEASAAGAIILVVFNLLRLAIRERHKGWKAILGRSRTLLLLTAFIVVLCQTNWFLVGARLPSQKGVSAATPIYGVPAIYIYIAYFAGAMLWLTIGLILDLRQTRGSERAELIFTLPIGVLTAGLSVLAVQVLRLWVPQSQLLWFAPFRAVIFSAVVAYGVATRKIMEVGVFFRRVISYTLLTLYLLGLYALVWWLLGTVLHSVQEGRTIAHIAAAIVIAFAMAPARGVSQRLAERLFITGHHVDFRATVSQAADILSSVTTLADLLQRFGDTVAEAVGAERLLILLNERNEFKTAYAFARSNTKPANCFLDPHDPIAMYLTTHREPVVLDELRRIRPTAEVVRLGRRMRELEIAVAVGIFAREHLTGIMLLGGTSGRVYSSVAQNALQVLCRQLAVAIDNAQLFTEVQNAKIYNETLLQNLTTGVIAAGIDESVTVFNNEAGQITGLKSSDVLDRSIDFIPNPLGDSLRQTLRTGEARENTEMVLHADDEELIVRASTSIFHGQDGKVLGALMVLTDVTALKRLELQIRRSDRLASLGTLSAGMAHEIKNPLVSIKTFAQLLPERYNDSDFRETFSNLIGHEIDRIDSLVNQLLRFARPAKPHLQPMHVHTILEKSLLLVGHRLYQKDIKLTRSWDANIDTIRADADQLEQVFLNFFINAMDAMKDGGELSIQTQIRNEGEWISRLPQSNGDAHEVLRVTIRDTGEGIRKEDLAHVFDPFFTTKDYGTGLGLSVVHGIIQEHGGQIEVESELKKGTAFHILLPLVRFDSKVAAA